MKAVFFRIIRLGLALAVCALVLFCAGLVGSLLPAPRAPQDAGPPRIPAGAGTIIESGQAPLLRYYGVSNHWYTKTSNETIIVYAGGLWNDPYFTDRSQGFVLEMFRSLNDTYTTRDSILAKTPSKSGRLRIIGAYGMRVTLTTNSGEIFVFDAESGKFD